MNDVKYWLQAFYQPCKVEILPKIMEEKLKGRGIDTQKNDNRETQYNAIHILKNVIQGIQNSKPGCIGVLALTDVDLFTKNLSNFCYGYGIPAYGGVQSIRRFRADWTEEEFNDKEHEDSWTLQRVLKIVTHELGHMFGMGHCTWY